ncbi:MAG TPA: CrcB family protein [Cellulomonas sp.]
MSRPHHTDPLLVGSVAAGGALGSLARYGLSHALPARAGWPVGTLTENLVGAFLLGLLLQALLGRGHETPRLRWARLTLGTGVLGGFTTYSAFALELHGLLAGGRLGVAVGYALVSVVGGTLACLGGVALARLLPGDGAPAARRAPAESAARSEPAEEMRG